jgi:hypothetical protein
VGFPELRLCAQARSARGRLIKHEGRDVRGPNLWWLGLRSCYGRERSSHPHQTAPHPHSPPTSLSSLSPLFPSIFTMQEDAAPQASSSHMMKTTKRGRPFLKARSSFSLPFLPSPSLTHPGHPRPIRNSRCFSATHNTQAILSVLPKLLLHVRLLIPLPPPYSKFSLPYSIPSLVMKLPQTLLLSSSPNPIVGQTLENPHE